MQFFLKLYFLYGIWFFQSRGIIREDLVSTEECYQDDSEEIYLQDDREIAGILTKLADMHHDDGDKSEYDNQYEEIDGENDKCHSQEARKSQREPTHFSRKNNKKEARYWLLLEIFLFYSVILLHVLFCVLYGRDVYCRYRSCWPLHSSPLFYLLHLFRFLSRAFFA